MTRRAELPRAGSVSSQMDYLSGSQQRVRAELERTTALPKRADARGPGPGPVIRPVSPAVRSGEEAEPDPQVDPTSFDQTSSKLFLIHLLDRLSPA